MRAIIVDDEIDAIKTIEVLTKEAFPDIEIVGTAQNIEKAKTLIEKNKPDILFLDIEMHRGNGFDLMEHFIIRDFEVVFVTAYNDYRLVADAYNIPYYITKPIDIDIFKDIIQEIEEKRASN